jgi:hypothetical protein
MSDFQVNAWRLTDFEGDFLSTTDPQQSGETRSGDWVCLPKLRLSATATPSSFFITDEQTHPDQHADKFGRRLSVLTEQACVAGIQLRTGQDIQIESILTSDDANGTKLIIGNVASSDGQYPNVRLVFSSAKIEAGQSFSLSHASDHEIPQDNTICFARGALVATPHGDISVEELEPSDEVITKNGGIVAVSWIGHRRLSGFDLALHPHLRPIRIRQNAFGANRPDRDLIVSPQHRILIDGWRAELYFGEDEILVPARALLNDTSVLIDRLQTGVDYYHVLLETHDLLLVNGQWAESLFPSAEALETLTDDQKEDLDYFRPGFFNTVTDGYTSILPSIHHELAAVLAS